MLDIARSLGVSAPTVRNRLELAGVLQSGVRAEQRTRRWHVRPEVFFEAERQDVAYFAGLLIADGSVRPAGNGRMPRLTLSLEEADRFLVEQLCDLIGLDRAAVVAGVKRTPLGHTTVHHRIDSHHRAWPEVLAPWGIIPRKSWAWAEPQVPDAVLPSFLRGWFDGDGSLSKDGSRWSLAGTPQGISWYLSALKRLGYTGGSYIESRAGTDSQQLAISGRRQVHQARRILDTPGPRMLRKWPVGAVRRTATPKEVGEYLGLSDSTIRGICNAGIVEFDQSGPNRYLDPAEVLEALAWDEDDIGRRARTSDVARALGLGDATVQHLAQAGVLPSRVLRRGVRAVRQYNIEECQEAYERYREGDKRRKPRPRAPLAGPSPS